MEKYKINPFDIMNEQFSTLQERFKSASDPREKSILQKRICNLQRVMVFLAANQPHEITSGEYA